MAILEEPIKEVKILKNFIGGKWVESKGELIDIANPVNGKVIAKVPFSTAEDVNAAVEAAHKAFPSWRRTPPLERARYLYRLRELIEKNLEEVSRIQTQEHGKVIGESRVETLRGIENIEVACGIPTLIQGPFSEDVTSGVDEYVVQEPRGVFGIIPPFNFPFTVPLFSAPYAVATGNCIIIKPSELVPISQARLAELVDEAGFPPGVWNVVQGQRAAVSGMLDHPGIAGIVFVGSTPTARDVICPRCVATGKRFIAQAGAKNSVVIMPDVDIEKVVPILITAFFGSTGQRCLAAANLIVVGEDDGFYNDLVEAITAAAKEIIIGNGLDEAVQMGPMHDTGQKKRVIGYIERGIQQGVEVRLDGRKNIKIVGGYPETCFIGPTILEKVTPDMEVAREEIFGPVMSVLRAKTLDEAIGIVNSSHYGNSSAIFTSSGKSAREFRYRSEAGKVGINVSPVAPMALFPFSGTKDSFYGVLHAQGQEAMRFFTESKAVMQRWL